MISRHNTKNAENDIKLFMAMNTAEDKILAQLICVGHL